MAAAAEAGFRRAGFAGWLARDWAYATEAEARRRGRPIWGAAAWVAFNVVTALQFHRVSIIGLPLVALMFLQARAEPSRAIPLMVLALTAVVAVVGWANGPAEWTTGMAEFKLALTLFMARCAWADFMLPRVRRNEAEAAFG